MQACLSMGHVSKSTLTLRTSANGEREVMWLDADKNGQHGGESIFVSFFADVG